MKKQAFLDTSVFISYLQGKEGLDRLFSSEVRKKVRYVINPIVFQELLLATGKAGNPLDINKCTKFVDVLPIDAKTTKESFDKLRELRNISAHANDLLIWGTAASCDYLVTYDRDFRTLGAGESVQVVSPEEFMKLLEGIQ